MSEFSQRFEDAKAKLEFTWVSDEWNNEVVFPQEDQKNLVALAILAANILLELEAPSEYIDSVQRSLSLAIYDLLGE
jgi:hypothetical protein